jgi:hypothetical protein
MSDELRVRGMVHRLDADDPFLEGVLVSLCVSEEVELRLGRPHDEDFTTPIQTARDLVKEPMLVVRMVPDPQRVFVVVAMDVDTGRVNDGLIEGPRVELEDARFSMIDPNDGVLRGALNH